MLLDDETKVDDNDKLGNKEGSWWVVGVFLCCLLWAAAASWWLDMISCCLMMKFKADDNEAEALVGE